MFDIEDFQEAVYPFLKEEIGTEFVSLDMVNKVVKFFENQHGRRGKMFMQLYPKSDKVHICKDNTWIKEDGLKYIANYFNIPEITETIEEVDSRFKEYVSEYIIASASTIQELQEIVTKKINDEKFMLEGGICIQQSPLMFYQTLIK